MNSYAKIFDLTNKLEMNTKACSVNVALGTSETGFSEEEKQICLQQLKNFVNQKPQSSHQ